MVHFLAASVLNCLEEKFTATSSQFSVLCNHFFRFAKEDRVKHLFAASQQINSSLFFVAIKNITWIYSINSRVWAKLYRMTFIHKERKDKEKAFAKKFFNVCNLSKSKNADAYVYYVPKSIKHIRVKYQKKKCFVSQFTWILLMKLTKPATHISNRTNKSCVRCVGSTRFGFRFRCYFHISTCLSACE